MKRLFITAFTFFTLTALQAQIRFTFDSTNASFFNVSTDTSTGEVTIGVKTIDRLEKEMMKSKSCIISYSLKVTNVEVDNHDGMGSHPAKSMCTTSKELPIIKITSKGKNAFMVKVQLSKESFEGTFGLKSLGWLPDERTFGFKMERLEMKQ